MGKKVKLKKIKPIVVYSSSLIQQNHGELLDKHGYLLWDVNERTYEEFDIHNDYGYVTIDVDGGEIPQWVYDEKDTKLPKYPRLRVRFKNTEPTRVQIVVSELKQMFNTSEVSVTRTDTIGQMKQNNHLNQNIVGNIKETSFQNSLISNYLERQFSLTQDKIDKILEINKEMNNNIKSTDFPDNILWIPKKFEFSNMFSYGEDNKIDFEKTKGIVGIFAPNASGKSAIFDSLSFCLFDKTARTHLSKNVINNRSDEFDCKFTFEINGIIYVIERNGSRVRNNTAVKVDVDFWKEVGGEKISLNGEQRRDTNKIIEGYLGTFDDFVLTSLSVQGNNALFIDKSQTERKEILSQFIGIDIFDKLYTIANEENRSNFSLVKKFKKNDFTTKLANYNNELGEKEDSYDIIHKELGKLEDAEDALNKKNIELTSNIIPLKNDNLDIDELNENRENLLEAQKNYKDDINENVELLEKLTTQEDELNTILSDLDKDSILRDYNDYQDLLKDENKIKNDIEKIDIQLESLESQYSHLDEHEYNPDCDICMKNSESILTSKGEISEKLDSISEKKISLLKSQKEVKDELTSLNEVEDKYSTLSKTEKMLSDVSKKIDTVSRKIERSEYSLDKTNTKIKGNKSLIKEYKDNKKQIKENNITRSKIKDVDKELKEVKGNIKSKNKKLLKLNGDISTIKSKLEQLNEDINTVKELEEDIKLYDYYLESIGRNGIPYELIQKTLPMIEGEVNNILSQIVDFGMMLEMDGKNIDSYIVYDDDKMWSLEMCSGMEKFISGLAIRVALINICNLPRPNFLVIDEGMGALDSENLAQMHVLFQYLKTQFDFINVISHLDTMRDMVDNTIEVHNINDKSKIRY